MACIGSFSNLDEYHFDIVHIFISHTIDGAHSRQHPYIYRAVKCKQNTCLVSLCTRKSHQLSSQNIN